MCVLGDWIAFYDLNISVSSPRIMMLTFSYSVNRVPDSTC